MRWVTLVVAFAVVVGCGKKAEPTVNETPTPPGPGPSPAKVDPVTPVSEEINKTPEESAPVAEIASAQLLKEYKEQPIAADQKYLGKRLTVKTGVSSVGRTKDGEAYIGVHYSDKVGVAPSVYLVFPKDREASLADLKVRDSVVLVGTCRGRINDGIVRAFPGYEFHVRVDDCRIVDPPKK